MTRAVRAELVKLLRRKVLAVTAAVTVLFSVGGAAVVLAAAQPAAEVRGDRGVSLESLSGAGGAAEVFTTAVSFVGTFLFVVFVGAIAVEFSRGTFRTMLLRQPGRLRLLAGKLTALLLFAATALAALQVLMGVAALLLAPGQDVDTGAWTSASAAGEAVAAYGSVLFWMTGYAVLGTALAVVVRSVPVALGIGIAWAGPFEHLLQDAWSSAGRVFPGLLLEAFVAGGTETVSATRALATVGVYVAAAAAVAGVAVTRRDVTA